MSHTIQLFALFMILVGIYVLVEFLGMREKKAEESDPRKVIYAFSNSNEFRKTDLWDKIRLIDGCIQQYKLAQFGRFYTVYCTELYNSFQSIVKCPIDSLRNEEMYTLTKTYMPIFDKILDDIEDVIRLQISVDCSAKVIELVSKVKGDRFDWEE